MPRIGDEATANLMAEAMRDSRGALVGVALVSALINVLYLTGSLFMLEVYDRVLPSQSVPTLSGRANTVRTTSAQRSVWRGAIVNRRSMPASPVT